MQQETDKGPYEFCPASRRLSRASGFLSRLAGPLASDFDRGPGSVNRILVLVHTPSADPQQIASTNKCQVERKNQSPRGFNLIIIASCQKTVGALAPDGFLWRAKYG